jgi:hypothetical protein
MPKPPTPQPTGLSEEAFYELQSDPAKFEAYIRQTTAQQAEEIADRKLAARDAVYMPVADRMSQNLITTLVPDYAEIKEEFDALLKEKGVTMSAVVGNDAMLKDAAEMARGRWFLAGKYKSVSSEEEPEVVDDGRSAMLAHGTTTGGGSSGKRSEWEGFSEEERRLAKQDGLKPDEFRAQYLSNDAGDFVSMPRKKAN